MTRFWKSRSGSTRFSIVAFFIVAAMGLLSMGILGAVLYYPVSFVLVGFPYFDDWHGDWVWPTFIAIGMLWSVGFLLGGIALHFLSKRTTSKLLFFVVYVFILWAWAALLWLFFLSQQIF